MIEVRGLTKRFGRVVAVDDLTFDVRPGVVTGFLGPNGSGKSTTVNLVVGLLQPSAGSIALDGLRLSTDAVAYKRRLGYVPEEPYLYPQLTAPEYLTLVGRLRGLRARGLRVEIREPLQLVDEVGVEVCGLGRIGLRDRSASRVHHDIAAGQNTRHGIAAQT